MRRRSQIHWLLPVLTMLCILAIALIALLSPPVHAGSKPRAVQVPHVSAIYRIKIEREAARHFGLNSQPARLAAQVHQESAWNPKAQSPYAQGLTQFTPSTAKWLPDVCPEVGPPDPWNPDWALGAQSCYMAWLYRRVPRLGSSPLTTCSRWAYALRGYNGGEGWLLRERRLAVADGADGNDWHAVAPYRGKRARWAHVENTEYPQRILLRIEPAYLAAGWPGGPACR